MTNHLFYMFIFIVGSVLAVLGLVLGQLFPFFSQEYYAKKTEHTASNIENVLHETTLSTSERAQILNALTLPDEQSEADLREEQARLTIILFIFLLLAFFIIWYGTKQVLTNFLTPILTITNTAKELSVGNYRARAFAQGPQSIIELKDAINSLANNLEAMTKTRRIEEERLKTLVETMSSGLIMMNREGQVSIVNRTFLANYQLTHEEIIGKSFLTIHMPEQLKKFIDLVFFTERTERRQMSVEMNGELTHKEVFGAPVVGEHGKWLGVVIVMHDISELVRLEQVRKDFVANVSHELRTPITSIKGFSETLLDGAYKDEAMLLSFVEIIHKESQRLQELVNDLLELSKIERNGFALNKEDVFVQHVLARVVDIESQKLEEKNIELTFDMEKDIRIRGDENRLIQVFTNLVNNAIMYSPANSTLKIAAYESEHYAVVEVQDAGIGMNKADIDRVFERFYRVDAARSRNSGGTGLGLAIVKHLVELHDGLIEVESEVGVGTTMRVKIPLVDLNNSFTKLS